MLFNSYQYLFHRSATLRALGAGIAWAWNLVSFPKRLPKSAAHPWHAPEPGELPGMDAGLCHNFPLRWRVIPARACLLWPSSEEHNIECLKGYLQKLSTFTAKSSQYLPKLSFEN